MQLLFEVEAHRNTIESCRSGVLLVVEVKKTSLSGPCELHDFTSVMFQTQKQARHAFSSYPRVNAFGVIIAIGKFWTYREYFRRDLGRSQSLSPTRSERFDPTFQPRDTNEGISMSKTYEAVEEIFGIGFACLQTTISDNALAAVRKRLTVFARNTVIT